MQSELILDEEKSTPDMRFASRLIGQVQRELAQQNRHLLRVVTKWITAYDYVKMLEEDFLNKSDQLQSHKDFFKGTLSVVKGLGHVLLAHLQSSDADKLETVGITYRDMVACVAELEDMDRYLNSDMTTGMVREMNERLFGGELQRR